MKTLVFFIFVFFIIISGCTSHDQSRSLSMYQNNTFNQATNKHVVELSDYAREIVADMAVNMRSIEQANAIAVTSFVFSNSSYESTNNLSFALADSFMNELHQFGLTTIDFKVTDFIRVTPQGDFSLSRDYLEINEEISVDYVLVGTITDFKKGYIIQARIVNIRNKEVLATGQTFIPSKLVNMLTALSAYKNTGFLIKV